MPIFDFACPCGRQTPDVLVPSYSTPVYCSVCGSQMERQPAAPAFALKGAGFYVNDSKAGPPPERKQPHYTGVNARAVSPERAFRK